MPTYADIHQQHQTAPEPYGQDMSAVSMNLAQAASDLKSTNQQMLLQMQEQNQNYVQQRMSNISEMGQRYAIGAGQEGVARTIQPGFVQMGNMGTIPSAYHAMGLSYLPSQAQGYTFGAYQRAQAFNVGQNMEGLGQMPLDIASGFLTFSGLANRAAEAFGGPLGAIAGQLGLPGMLAAPLDVLNPISYAQDELMRANAFGSRAGMGAFDFLRGGGQGRTMGTFSISEQAEIGRGLSEITLRDLTYSSEDILQLQQDFNEQGRQFLGVQDAEQYRKRFKDMLDTHKTITKALQLSSDEAVRMMDEMFSNIGFDHGTQMTRFASKVYAGAQITGMTPMQVASQAVQGAQLGRSSGLLSTTGADIQLMSQNFASMGASFSVPTDLLATVGGEQGITSMISRDAARYAGGVGGALMHFNRGYYGTDVFQGLQHMGSQVSGQNIIDFLANRHELVGQFSAEEIMAQSLAQDIGIAEQLNTGASTEDEVKMILQGRGMSSAQADAYLKTLRSAPESLRRESAAMQQQQGDLVRDQIAEQRSIVNRARLGYREFMMEDMGAGRLIREQSESAALFGQAMENRILSMSDAFAGVGERQVFTGEMSRRLGDDVAGFIRVSEGSESNDLLMQARGAIAGPSDTAGYLRQGIREAIEDNDVNKLGQAVMAIRQGSRITSPLSSFGPDSGGSGTTTYGHPSMFSDAGNMRGFFRDPAMFEGVSMDDMISVIRGAGQDPSSFMRSFGIESLPEEGVMDSSQRKSKALQIIGGASGAVSGDDLDEALQNEDFREFLKHLENLFKNYDKLKSGEGQSDKYKSIERAVALRYSKLRGNSKNVADNLLMDKKIRIEGNRVSFEGFKGVLDTKTTSVFGKGMEPFFADFEKSIQREFVGKSIERAMQDIVGGEIDFIDNEAPLGEQMASIADYLVGGLSDKQLSQMEKSNDIEMMEIARLTKLQKGSGLSREQLQELGGALYLEGRSGAIGVNYGAQDTLDPSVIGGATIDRKTIENLSKTAAVLEELINRLDINERQ